MASVGDVDQEQMERDLSLSAMKGRWEDVKSIYSKHPTAYTAKVTPVGDTALHLAIFDGKEEVVQRLVDMVTSDALKEENEEGSTPLHLAAALGSAPMCRYIVAKDSTLAGCRNKKNETPIFTAVLHGKLEAYRVFVSMPGCKDHAESRNDDGDTILHAAICGEFFELAFHISHRFEDLMTKINTTGFTPLHLLASKPHAFRSGSYLGWYSQLIYHCLLVEELEPTSLELMKEPSKPVKLFDYPKNYETCFLWYPPLVKFLDRKQKESAPSRAGESSTCPANIESQSNISDTESSTCLAEIESQSSISDRESDPRGPVPPNWNVIFACVRFLHRSILVVLGIGSREIKKLEAKKKKHTWSVQLLKRLLKDYQPYEDFGSAPKKDSGSAPNEDSGSAPNEENMEITSAGRAPAAFPYVQNNNLVLVDKNNMPHQNSGNQSCKNVCMCPCVSFYLSAEQRTQKQERPTKVETPILLAAKDGITEIVDMILDTLPVAIHNTNADDKNIVHLAVEHRQPQILKLLKKRRLLNETLFGKVDRDWNSALHLAARLTGYRAWNIPGEALQMQWEIKWYEYVKYTMPLHYFVRQNRAHETPKDIFIKSHKELMHKSVEWLKSTSSSCSVVAALIATVAFATSSTVPGGNDEHSGRPTLENRVAFQVFTISSLAALCFSVTSLLMFLSILTSRHQERDFGRGLPRKLLLGLSSLFVSVGAILVSFCAAESFVLSDQIKFGVIPVYTVTCLPMTIFALAQFPLYVDLLSANFRTLPLRSYTSTL